MLKTSNLSLLGPLIKSSQVGVISVRRKPITPLRTTNKKTAVSRMTSSSVQYYSLGALALFAALLVLHVFWINTYSSKGFELKRVQTAIEEQTVLQKKLLVEQSMLGSISTIASNELNYLVPITEVEYISGSSLARAK